MLARQGHEVLRQLQQHALLWESLTPCESEVLGRLSEGKPNKVIARELGIREGTVKVFVRRILSKLHVSNRTQLALLARAWGLWSILGDEVRQRLGPRQR